MRLKEKVKQDEREKEAKRLKEFLEDYDDERDDIKYYKCATSILNILYRNNLTFLLILFQGARTSTAFGRASTRSRS